MTAQTEKYAKNGAKIGGVAGAIGGVSLAGYMIFAFISLEGMCGVYATVFQIVAFSLTLVGIVGLMVIAGAGIGALIGNLIGAVTGKNNDDTTPKPEEKDSRTPVPTLDDQKKDPTVNFDRKTEEPNPQHDTELNKL